MLPANDLKNFLRDLVYLQEETRNLVKQTNLSEELQKRVMDNIQEKQIILSKIIALTV